MLTRILMMLAPLHWIGAQRPDTSTVRVLFELRSDPTLIKAGFGEVSGLAFDRAGRLYVSDFQEAHIVVIDQSGRVAALVGRRGTGPGEFSAPTGPAFGSDGTLYVRDLQWVHRFRVNQRTGVADRFAGKFFASANPMPLSKIATGVHRSGDLLVPSAKTALGGADRHYYVRFSPDGTRGDSIPVPPYPNIVPYIAYFALGERGGRVVKDLNAAPFEAAAVWAVNLDGNVVSSSGNAYSLTESGLNGVELGQYERSIAPARIHPQVRAESLAALRSRVAALPVPVGQLMGTTELVRQGRVPDFYPVISGVSLGAGREVWVQRPPEGSRTTTFDVFSASRHYARSVVVPRICAPKPAPVVLRNRVACVVRDVDSGEDGVIVAIVERQGER